MNHFDNCSDKELHECSNTKIHWNSCIHHICQIILNLSSEFTDYKKGIKLTGFDFDELFFSHMATVPSVFDAYNLCASCVNVKLKTYKH